MAKSIDFFQKVIRCISLYINKIRYTCVFTPQKYTLSNTKTQARAASKFSPLSPLPRLFAIQKSIILRKQCGNGENNAKTLLSYNYFLRFSNQIFTDFWPQATPSIGRRPTPLMFLRCKNTHYLKLTN